MSIVDRVFVDTNVLVYARLEDAPLCEVAQRRLDSLVAEKTSLWMSRQIIREYLASLTRGTGLTGNPPMSELLADVEYCKNGFSIAEDGPKVTQRLVELLSATACAGKQIHDANIVATMLAHDVGRLLTHNVQDFHRFSSFVAVEPLVA